MLKLFYFFIIVLCSRLNKSKYDDDAYYKVPEGTWSYKGGLSADQRAKLEKEKETLKEQPSGSSKYGGKYDDKKKDNFSSGYRK